MFFVLPFNVSLANSFDLITNDGQTIISPDYLEEDIDYPGPEGTHYTDKQTEEQMPEIDPISLMGNDNISARVDNRVRVTDTTQYPYSTIVNVQVRYPNGEFTWGSGSMIGVDTVLTAGHVVYDKRYGGWAKEIKVYPALNGTLQPYGSIDARQLTTTNGWLEHANTAEGQQYDIGLIRLNNPIGSYTGWLGLNTTITTNQKVSTTGYPSGKSPKYSMWTTSENITKFNTKNIYMTNPVSPGQSGSPVYNTSNQVVSILAYADSSGPRMNVSIYNYVQNTINNYVSIYRLRNPNNGFYFYTKNEKEVSQLTSVGWKYEQVSWFAPSQGNNVYRLYNPNSGVHFYTANSSERDSLVNAGWRSEGVAWYSDINKSMSVYWLYKNGVHFYTTNNNEKNTLINQGWKYEGIAWYSVL